MANKLTFGEGASINRPPLFCGVSYQLWCIRMTIFVDFIDRKIWDVIPITLLEINNVFSKSEKDHLDCVSKNIIVSAIDSNEFLRVLKCVSAKDMWGTLKRIHKDSRNAWLDSDKFSSGSSTTASKINVCLMAKEDSALNNVSTSSSSKCDSYYQLL